jgi:hypothetical protein
MWSANPQLRQVRAATLGHYELSVSIGMIEANVETHIFGKVASLVALATLDTLSRTRLGAFFCIVALLLAVLAGIGVDALFGAIAGSVADFLTVYALNLGLLRLALSLLLLAVLYVGQPQILRTTCCFDN